MGMNDTPSGERVHIGFFGRRNAGKSSVVNAVTGQNLSIVSATKGTTTDPVYKAMELLPLGPVVIIDTPGIDDVGALGEERVRRTKQVLNKTDIAVVIVDGTEGLAPADEEVLALIRSKGLPYLIVYNKADLVKHVAEADDHAIHVSALTGDGIYELKEKLARLKPADAEAPIVSDLIHSGDMVVLVVPIDSAAPKGRLILPQVQTIRELLDKKCRVVCCTTDQIEGTLSSLAAPPKLIITDSQVFSTVYAQKPAASLLTSFSVLFARYKGDIDYFVESAAAIGQLREDSRVLIAEACTHAPVGEDIGRVKIPAMLRKRIGPALRVDVVAGTDFPADLTPYDLVIHCGACMFNRRHVLSRVAQARAQHVPMTNYGVAIAYLQGILDKIEY